MFTLILGEYEESIVDEDRVEIFHAYNGNPTLSFRHAQALEIGIRH